MYCLMCRKQTEFVRELNHSSDLHYCSNCDIEYPVSKELKKEIECPHCQNPYLKKLKDHSNIICKKCSQLYHVEIKYYSESLLIGYYISKKVY